jgi:hypothetical protein
MVKACALTMSGAATNLEAFSTALDCLTEGKATDHTPASSYVESVWPVIDDAGRVADLVWPGYGGEQVRNLVTQRRIPAAWRERVLESFAAAEALEEPSAYEPSDQARTIELLQMLLYLAQFSLDRSLSKPRLTILLSCWDELGTADLPANLLALRLPMLWAFVRSNWTEPNVMGLSALERALSKTDADRDYAIRGPEDFGYVVLPDGTQSPDITLPIQRLMAGVD